MAYIYLFADWNLPGAEAELSGVKDRNANVLNNLANLRAIQGRLEESLELRKEVVRLDPLHAIFYTNLAQTLLRLGRLDEADAAVRKTLELQPTARSFMAVCRPWRSYVAIPMRRCARPNSSRYR